MQFSVVPETRLFWEESYLSARESQHILPVDKDWHNLLPMRTGIGENSYPGGLVLVWTLTLEDWCWYELLPWRTGVGDELLLWRTIVSLNSYPERPVLL